MEEKRKYAATIIITGSVYGERKTDDNYFSFNMSWMEVLFQKHKRYLFELFDTKSHVIKCDNDDNNSVVIEETIVADLRIPAEKIPEIKKIYPPFICPEEIHFVSNSNDNNDIKKSKLINITERKPVYVAIKNITVMDNETGKKYYFERNVINEFNSFLYENYADSKYLMLCEEMANRPYELIIQDAKNLALSISLRLDIPQSVANLWAHRILTTFTDEGKRAAILFFVYNVDKEIEVNGISLWDILRKAWIYPMDALDLYNIAVSDPDTARDMMIAFINDRDEREEWK